MIVAMTTMKRREHFEIGPGRAVWTGTPYSDDRHNDPMPPTPRDAQPVGRLSGPRCRARGPLK